jgi:hypothetical protein
MHICQVFCYIGTTTMLKGSESKTSSTMNPILSYSEYIQQKLDSVVESHHSHHDKLKTKLLSNDNTVIPKEITDDIVVIPKEINNYNYNYCDYTGIIPLGVVQKIIEVPRNSLFGISCIESLSGRAAKDVYIFCRSHGIYPMNSAHSEFSARFPKVNIDNIIVQRSSGVIEKDWSIDMYASTCFEDGEVIIPVIKLYHNIAKGVPIRLFCKLNGLIVDDLAKYLSDSLFKWFSGIHKFSDFVGSIELAEEKFF